MRKMCLIYIYIYIYICFNNDGEGVRLIAALIIIMILIAAWFFAMGMPVWLGIIFAIVIVFSVWDYLKNSRITCVNGQFHERFRT